MRVLPARVRGACSARALLTPHPSSSARCSQEPCQGTASQGTLRGPPCPPHQPPLTPPPPAQSQPVRPATPPAPDRVRAPAICVRTWYSCDDLPHLQLVEDCRLARIVQTEDEDADLLVTHQGGEEFGDQNPAHNHRQPGRSSAGGQPRHAQRFEGPLTPLQCCLSARACTAEEVSLVEVAKWRKKIWRSRPRDRGN